MFENCIFESGKNEKKKHPKISYIRPGADLGGGGKADAFPSGIRLPADPKALDESLS